MNVPNMNNVPTGPHWPEPVSLSEGKNVPPFPTHVLSEPLRDFVKAGSASTQVRPEMFSPVVLCALSTAVQGRYQVVRPDGSTEQVCLYQLTIARPGERKSQTIKRAFSPIFELEEELRREGRADILHRRAEKEAREKEVSRLKARAKREDPEQWNEYLQAYEEYEHFTVPTPAQLTVENVTPERLIEIQSEQGEVTAQVSAEGGVFLTFLGQYSGMVDTDVLTKSYSGDYTRADRKNGTAICMESPALTICVMLQPSVLQDLFGALGVGTQGLLERFMFSMPKVVPHRAATAPSIPQDVLDGYGDLLKAVGRTARKKEHRENLTISSGAWEVYTPFYDEIERLIAPGGQWYDDDFKRGWGSKLAGTALRLAALLHIADETCRNGEPVATSISREAMEGAVELGRYFIGQTLTAYAAVNATKTQKMAEKILKVIRRENLQEFVPSDLTPHMVEKSVKEYTPGLNLLENLHHIAEKPPEQNKTGRRATRYIVNPRAWESNQLEGKPEELSRKVENYTEPQGQAEERRSPTGRQSVENGRLRPAVTPATDRPKVSDTQPPPVKQAEEEPSGDADTELEHQGDLLQELQWQSGAERTR